MPVDGVELAELLRLALDVGQEVGAELVRARREGAPSSSTKTSSTDMLTTMDLWAEKHIVERLVDERPTDGFVGEEGTDIVGTSGVRWCVDPIDGTTDYLYDHPGYSVSIAALVDGVPAVGVVVDPALGQTYSAVVGHGAWRDNVPIRASACNDLSLALVGTGFSYDPARRGRQGAVLARVLPHVRDVRRMGGAATDLCSVGCARLDVFYERGLNVWDVAAGGLVAQEAGAVVTDLDGNPTWSGTIVAAPPRLLAPLLSLLREAGVDDA
ncbi:MAG TPA: inositol monophosphatase family protein [Acidimicrobiales bacterium]|jgi:myo-inositol-1(or 4)-monophosphatase|nr:inositol monophosphatase family protein [Acidimicrobiales bacterium]